ncbi:hypothetical protein LOK49_LG10G02219 [Camellia lanceoleosa]|uniref:Uncharacterized protein n=1 Tax=Camellia lanceoleosa TaxID=1840588 RepID=A0ACC0G6H1_9ERIC|nr:hypothetical protein LOK49_LG10G02219 [Camellia lanceoleosa]
MEQRSKGGSVKEGGCTTARRRFGLCSSKKEVAARRRLQQKGRSMWVSEKRRLQQEGGSILFMLLLLLETDESYCSCWKVAEIVHVAAVVAEIWLKYVCYGLCGHCKKLAPESLGAEKDGLDIIQHEWALPKFEQRAEATLRKLIS